MTLVQEPGAGFIYSNLGYVLLALLVETPRVRTSHG